MRVMRGNGSVATSSENRGRLLLAWKTLLHPRHQLRFAVVLCSHLKYLDENREISPSRLLVASIRGPGKASFRRHSYHGGAAATATSGHLLKRAKAEQ